MIHDIEISLVLDLPENPSEEQVLNAVAEALMRKFRDHILDGCMMVRPSQDGGREFIRGEQTFWLK